MSPPLFIISQTDDFRIIREKISISEILYLSGYGNYSQIHLSSGRVILCSFSLNYFEKTLDRLKFLRIHNSTIVNLDFVEKKMPEGLILNNGAILPVSRYKRTVLQARIKPNIH